MGFYLPLIAQAKMICSRAVFTVKLSLLCRAASSSRVACRIIPTALWASSLVRHDIIIGSSWPGHHGFISRLYVHMYLSWQRHRTRLDTAKS